jgi:long-subunit acyl-CoA synthetase (AMP-forming)
VSKGGFLVNLLFKIAFKAKVEAMNENRDTPLFNLLVFNKFKQNVGGNLKVMVK